jgi:hypothetical protein
LNWTEIPQAHVRDCALWWRRRSRWRVRMRWKPAGW